MHRAFKIRCAILEIRMRDATAEALEAWMERDPA
ncbi:hypothetical protein [Streptomyces virginiae]